MNEPPPLPKTTQLPAVPEWAIELTRSVKSGFGAINSRLDAQEVSLERVVNEGIRTNTRLTRIEERVDELEMRIGRASNRVREVSQTDLEQSAQLVQERTAREAITAKVDALAADIATLSATNSTQLAILSRLDRVTSNPMVKTVAAMIATALITWLTSHGIGVSK